MKQLATFTLFNHCFMGSMRDGLSNIDGHVGIITDGNEFCINSFNDYGGFKSVGADLVVPELNDAAKRFLHDAVLEHFKVDSLKNNPEAAKFFEVTTRYPLSKIKQSFNIQFGDIVEDIRTGELFHTKSGFYDLAHMNRNFFYRIISRPTTHPEPVSLETFKNKLANINPFNTGDWAKDWTEVDKPTGDSYFWFKVNGKKYSTYFNSKSDTYFIKTPEDKVYSKQSNISAPFWDTIDLLCGHVYSDYNTESGYRFNYCIFDCESSKSKWGDYPEIRFKKFDTTDSYHYNNRLTYL